MFETKWEVKTSQKVHKKISTHLLTVLIIDVILHVEQRKRKEKSSGSGV